MKNSIRTVGNIFFIIFFSKLLGQIREMMIAGSYGTGMEANAFLTATQIPLNFFDIILGGAIVSAFVPVFNEYYENGGLQQANAFANRFVGVITVISVVISALGVIFSSTVVGLLASGFDVQTAALTSVLLKIMFPAMLFTAVAYAYAGVLQSMGEFNAPAAMSIVSNGVTILYLLIFKDKFGIMGLSVSMLLGWAMQLVLLLPYLIKRKFKFGFVPKFNDSGMKKVYKLALPILLSAWVQPLNVMFNTYLASYLHNGQAVSAINYANKLYLIIASVFTVAITNLILPQLSRLFVANEHKKAGEVIGNSLKATALFILPVMALFVVFAKPIVEIVYKSGKFDDTSVRLTSTALMCYSIGMIGYSFQEVLNKSFYAMQMSKVPMQTAFIAIGVNIAVSLSLFRWIGIAGLSLAAATAAIVSGIVLFIRIIRVNPNIPAKNVLFTVFKSMCAAVITAALAKTAYQYTAQLANGRLWQLILVGGICIITLIIYVLLLVVFRCKEIYSLKNVFKKEEETVE